MTARTQDQDAIEVTIRKYIDGIGQHNTDLIVEAFHPQAIMSGHRGEHFSIIPAAESIVAYMNSITPVSESSPDFAGRIISVDQKDTMATAIIAEDALEGLNFITYFHLHKVDGEWLITSKATYGEPA
tara:strand:- start:626 stop:1009 length:384 start_codon:yes stop_codon:yes gene_type:complete